MIVLELLIAGGLFLCAIVLVAASMHSAGRWWLRSFAAALCAFGITEVIEAIDSSRWHIVGDIAEVGGGLLLLIAMVRLVQSAPEMTRSG